MFFPMSAIWRAMIFGVALPSAIATLITGGKDGDTLLEIDTGHYSEAQFSNQNATKPDSKTRMFRHLLSGAGRACQYWGDQDPDRLGSIPEG